MKIISGSLKGRNIKGYDIDGTRPTMDRVKESLFGIIQNYVCDSYVLDLFAGTGNLGFEAISNGAQFCYFNDLNKKCVALIENNILEFNIREQAKVLNFDYKDALVYFKNKNIKFDLIFLDPPYKKEVINEILKYIYDNSLLNTGGIVICESDSLYVDFALYEKIKEKKYGDKYIVIYKNNL